MTAGAASCARPDPRLRGQACRNAVPHLLSPCDARRIEDVLLGDAATGAGAAEFCEIDVVLAGEFADEREERTSEESSSLLLATVGALATGVGAGGVLLLRGRSRGNGFCGAAEAALPSPITPTTALT